MVQISGYAIIQLVEVTETFDHVLQVNNSIAQMDNQTD